MSSARQYRRFGQRRERARARQPFGMGRPVALVQPRVKGIKNLLGKNWILYGSGCLDSPFHNLYSVTRRTIFPRILPCSARA